MTRNLLSNSRRGVEIRLFAGESTPKNWSNSYSLGHTMVRVLLAK